MEHKINLIEISTPEILIDGDNIKHSDIDILHNITEVTLYSDIESVLTEIGTSTVTSYICGDILTIDVDLVTTVENGLTHLQIGGLNSGDNKLAIDNKLAADIKINVIPPTDDIADDINIQSNTNADEYEKALYSDVETNIREMETPVVETNVSEDVFTIDVDLVTRVQNGNTFLQISSVNGGENKSAGYINVYVTSIPDDIR